MAQKIVLIVSVQDLQAEARQLSTAQEISWQRLCDITKQLRKASPDTATLCLHEVCTGTQLVLHAPQKRAKSKELQERLSRLQEKVDQASYNKMVAEVTQQVH